MIRACAAAGRDPDSVGLLAASKTRGAEEIRALGAMGQRDFGESYVDEAVEKIEQLSDAALRWHYIGPIQSNKSKAIARHFDWVQSVDRARIVRRLDTQRPDDLPALEVLIQVNIDDEPQKAGCRAGEIGELAAMIASCQRLNLRGLMAIPAPRAAFAEQQRVIEKLHALFEKLRADHPDVDTLSAGMSADLEAAIAAGSTMVRVGTALFGPRG